MVGAATPPRRVTSVAVLHSVLLMRKTSRGSQKRSRRIDSRLAVRTGATRFTGDRTSMPIAEFDGGTSWTWILEGPYSLTTCALRVPDVSGDAKGATYAGVREIYRRFLCTPFGTLVLEPAARFDPWFEGVDAEKFDALTRARDFSPLPFTPFMRDFDANLVGEGMARFFSRLAAKQDAMSSVHGAWPVMGEIPYGLREAVLHACAHDGTGVLRRLVDEAPKVFVALGACLGDRPDRWVGRGRRGSKLADPLARLAAGEAHDTCIASALEAVTGRAVDARVVDDLHFLARFVVGSSTDYTWLVARALGGFERADAPTRPDSAAWSAWLRTKRPRGHGRGAR